MSSAYNSLDPRVRKWVYKQGWSSLRPLQESSIPAILARDRDVLISAGTAAGKTEAFFLPACSAIADLTGGFGIIYISPLKALINDQLNRPGFPGECFICELRLPDHRFRWKHNKLFLLLPEEYGPAFPAIVDCYTSPPT